MSDARTGDGDDRNGGARRKDTRPISLALQGGGAHGAYTWGVLDRLLEDERLEVEGVSGTSAGAMNAAVLADGLMEGGRDGARRALERFWSAVAEIGRFGPLVRTPFDMVGHRWNLDHSPGYVLFDALSRYLSPYQFNPMNWNPLLDALRRQVNFERVRACDRTKLFIAATSVTSGKIRVFHTDELTAEAVMASACLPHVFQAVEVEGDAYWDGGYMGNPAIYPLIYNCDSRDVVIVQVNPIERDEVPTTTPDILDRLNEVTFNSTLMREMRAIAFVDRLLAEHRLDERRYKRMLMHRVDVAEEMRELSVSSKMNAEWDFLVHLRDLGRREAGAWLKRNYAALGRRATVDIEADYL